MRTTLRYFAATLVIAAAGAGRAAWYAHPAEPGTLLRGEGHNGDWSVDAPGVRHLITVRDLPRPFETESHDSGQRTARRPEGALPKAPAGFRVEQYASGIANPRLIRTAPNGDVFIADSMPAHLLVLRDVGGKAEIHEYASNLRLPFGIAFYPLGPNPEYIYVGDTDAVVRFPYRSGDLRARGPMETIAELPGGGRLRGGGHWTRDVAFSRDGKRMFVSVGSRTNDLESGPDERDAHRATVLEFDPDGRNMREYATGVRNAVGIAVNPTTGDLWGSVNERDGLGDDLPPDYITRIRPGGYYGWPWYYIGPHPDPKHRGAHPELQSKVLTPDVLLQSHSASLEMCFYTGHQFPGQYDGVAFAAEHGSWNREKRTGYKVIYVPIHNGIPTGEYVDFLTGMVDSEGLAWGRPVGVTVARDGSLLVSDDAGGCIWRVTYAGQR